MLLANCCSQTTESKKTNAPAKHTHFCYLGMKLSSRKVFVHARRTETETCTCITCVAWLSLRVSSLQTPWASSDRSLWTYRKILAAPSQCPPKLLCPRICVYLCPLSACNARFLRVCLLCVSVVGCMYESSCKRH